MLFLLLLFKNHKKLLKIAIALSLLVFLYLVGFMLYLLKNVAIEITAMDIVDGYLETRMTVSNDTPFDVFLNDLRMNLNVVELTETIYGDSRFKGRKIAGEKTVKLKFRFHIITEYEADAIEGDIIVILSKFYIKVPLKQKIGANSV